MSIQTEKEISEVVNREIEELIRRIEEKYPGSFACWAPSNSPVGVTQERYQEIETYFKETLKAVIRWPLWLKRPD
jgi:hypothetical protein